jgi:hypothetical protein
VKRSRYQESICEGVDEERERERGWRDLGDEKKAEKKADF